MLCAVLCGCVVCGVWVCGCVAVWVFGFVGLWVCGAFGASPVSRQAGRPCGLLAFWRFGLKCSEALPFCAQTQGHSTHQHAKLLQVTH